MEIIIGILVLLVITLWKKIKNVEEQSNKSLKKNQEMIDNQKKALYETIQKKDNALEQVSLYAKEIEELKKEIEGLERKINFYKNIKEESGKLNVFDDTEEREKLLEKTVQQINYEKEIDALEIDLLEDSIAGITDVLDEEQAKARLSIEDSNDNFFITGKAGTGKSFLLDVFRRTTNKEYIVLAPTGIAALNVKGVTLHSAFGYNNLVSLDVDAISNESIILKSEKKMILRKVSTIIIDEISMVRADTFDKIDKILRVINQNDSPFGGKQVLLFGDLFQLPPVAKKVEYDYLYDRYGGEYFFCSDAYKYSGFKFIELTINHRQKDDSRYFSLLNRVRDGSLDVKDIEMLNSRVSNDISIYDRYTTLLPTKAEAEQLNQYHIDQLDSKEYVYHAKIVYDKYPNHTHKLESVFPISSTLCLKKGALIMMVANDSEHRWVNGTLGIINDLSDERISVAINKQIYDIYLQEFSEQEIVYENGKLVYEDILRVAQFPVVLAYAITIHKSQGQTYQNIVCDIDKCFANGQAYVALSRCASLEGLHLKQPISVASILVDKRVLDFYEKQIK